MLVDATDRFIQRAGKTIRDNIGDLSPAFMEERFGGFSEEEKEKAILMMRTADNK